MLRLTVPLLTMLVLPPAAAWSEPEPGEVVPAPQPQLNPLADGRLGPLTALRERPLFAPTRRVPAPPAPPPPPPPPRIVEIPAAPPPSPPALRLIGIVEAGGTRFVLLSCSDGPTQTMRVGDKLDAWTVSAIGPQSITLRIGERKQTYPVFATKTFATSALTPSGDAEPQL